MRKPPGILKGSRSSFHAEGIKMNRNGTGPKDIPAFVILIAITGMILAFSLLILSTLQEDERMIDCTGTQYNATLNNGSAVSLGQDLLCAWGGCVNASNQSQTLPTTNYTVQMAAGTITLIDASWDGNSTECSFSYEARNSEAYNATGSAIEAGGIFGDWLPLIVLVIVAIIMIGLIMRGLGGGKI